MRKVDGNSMGVIENDWKSSRRLKNHQKFAESLENLLKFLRIMKMKEFHGKSMKVNEMSVKP